MPFRLFFLLTLIVAMPATSAYKWTAPDGTVVFSDSPPHPDAEEIKLPLTPTIRANRKKPTVNNHRMPFATPVF